MTASAALVDVEDLAAIVETVVTADTDDVTWEMLRRAVPLESSLLLFVAGLVEAVVLLLRRIALDSSFDKQDQGTTKYAAER